MTIPTLITSTREKVNVARLKKAHATFDSAVRMAVSEDGTVDSWAFPASNDYNSNNANYFLDKIIPYLRLTKVCYRETGCFPANVWYKMLHGPNYIIIDQHGLAKAQLADGTFFGLEITPSRCNRTDRDCGRIWLDVNGYDKPNQMGVDTFQFLIGVDNVLPFGLTDKQMEATCSMKSSQQWNGFSCGAWVVYNENMDYLHCDNLSWQGKKKCK